MGIFKYFDKKLLFLLSISLFLVIFFAPSPAFASVVFQSGVDKYNYLPTENITIRGTVWDATTPIDGAILDVTITNGTDVNLQATSDSNGSFSIKYNASGLELGSHNISVYYAGMTSNEVTFSVTNVVGAVGGIANNVYWIHFNKGWGKKTSIDNQTAIFYNDTLPSDFPYYILAENSTTNVGTYECKRIFIDDDDTFNFTDTSEDSSGIPESKYLEQDSKFKINTTNYFVIFIDPKCTKAVIVEPSVYSFNGGENVKIVAALIDANGEPVVEGSLLFEVFNQDGQSVLSENHGNFFWDFTIPSSSGRYFMFVNGFPIGSFAVERFVISASIIDVVGNPASVIGPGESIRITAVLTNKSDNTAITSDASVGALIPNSSDASGVTIYMMSYDDIIGRWSTEVISGPSSGYVTYKVGAEIDGEIQVTTVDITVKSFKLNSIPIQKEKGDGEGFGPNTPAALIVTATNMTDGSLMNLTEYTSNCANDSLVLRVMNNIGKDVLSNFVFSTPAGDFSGRSHYNFDLSSFFDDIITDAPSGVVEEFIRSYGAKSCVIVFQTPNIEGFYMTNVSANISGTLEQTLSSFVIQSLFVKAHPMSEYNDFIWYFSPGERVYLGIDAFTHDGTQIPYQNITSASIIEVIAEDGTVVTDQMLNETFTNTTIGGNIYATLSFVANDSVMGFHNVRFRITAIVGNETKDGTGNGYFFEKKYHVFAWSQTSGDRWFFSQNDIVTLMVQVYDASAFQSFGKTSEGNQSTSNEEIQGLTVSIDEIRSWENGGLITTWSAGTGTTDGQGQAMINITPTSTWPTGGMGVKIKVTKSGITDYGYGWFEVRSFMFWAWTQDWQVSANQSIKLSLNTQNASWYPISANVKITDIIYHGGFGSWTNTPIDFGENEAWNENVTDNGYGEITIPEGKITKSGEYEIVLNATYESLSQTTRTWFRTTSFVLTVMKDRNNWDDFYEPGEILNITIKAGKKIDWSQWPPNVTNPVSISSAWIGELQKEGVYGPMMTKGMGEGGKISEGTLAVGTNCDGSTYICQVWFNTSDLSVGRYHMQIVANDTSGNEETTFDSFQIKTFNIRSPELKWITIPTTSGYKFSNASAIKTDQNWKTCADSTVVRPNVTPEVTNCKVIDQYNMTDGPAQTVLSVLIDFDNKKVYLDTNGTHDFDFNLSDPDNTISIYNVSNYTNVDGIFYKITSVGDTVVLESNNSVSLDSGGNGKADYVNTDWDGQGDTIATYIVPNAVGDFYAAFKSQQEWNILRDDSWLQIDLNGDNNYFDNDDLYHIVVRVLGGLVQNIYVSNGTNLAAPPTHTYPSSSNEPANFTESGTNIYFVGVSYQERSGQSAYEIKFTSNRTGWGGNIGTFSTNANVSIPVIVERSTGRIANANVSIYKIAPMGMGPPTEQDLSIIASARTDSNGIAVIKFNTSWLPYNGIWALKVNATAPGGLSGEISGMPWEWPQIEKRDFKLRIIPGVIGRIQNVKELSYSAETLFNYTLYEISGKHTGIMNNICGGNGYVMDQDYRYNRLIMNISEDSTHVFVRNENDDPCNWEVIKTRPSYAAGDIIPIQQNGYKEFVKLTKIAQGGTYSIALNWDLGIRNATDLGMFLKLTDYNATAPEAIKLDCKYLEWNWEIVGPDWQGNDSYVCNGMFKTNFVGSGWVNLTLQPFVIQLDNPWNLNLGGEWKVIKIANVTGTPYEMLYYDDASVISGENFAGKTSTNPDGWTFADRIILINAGTGTVVNNTGHPDGKYFIGERISEINKTVFGGRIWETKIILTDQSDAPYPLPWTCDGSDDRFYYANFSETDIGIDLNSRSSGPNQPIIPNPSQYYSILFFDNECNGVKRVSGGFYDDDLDMMQSNACPDGGQPWMGGSCSYDQMISLDLYGTDGKSGSRPNETSAEGISDCPGCDSRKFDEQWFNLGGDSYPVAFIDETVNATKGYLDTIKETEYFNQSSDVSYYIKARKLDGTAVQGNVSIDFVMDMRYMTELTKPYDNTTLVNGVGVLKLESFTNMTGPYVVRLKVCDATLNACESEERPVYVGSMDDMKYGGGPAPVGVGYGGPGP